MKRYFLVPPGELPSEQADPPHIGEYHYIDLDSHGPNGAGHRALVLIEASKAAPDSWIELPHLLDAVSTLAYPLQTLLFRVDYLLGGPFEIVKPEVGSIAQLNYRLLTAGVLRIREGSAPGLIASFNYVLAFPLNIVCCALYLRWLSNRVEALLSGQRHRRLSLLGVLLLITFLQVFFQSPFDFLMLIDDAVIYMVLLVGLSVAQREVRAEREPAAPLVRKATGMGVI